jgi:hypothetical protein
MYCESTCIAGLGKPAERCGILGKISIKIPLQTTISYEVDNWHIGRFSLLGEHPAGLTDQSGQPQ